ncbi:leucine-rich repeat transmembrane protein kinase family protein [Wolffia australiana]
MGQRRHLACCWYLLAAALTAAATAADMAALLQFKATADLAGNLATWNASDVSPCGWPGVECGAAGGAASGRVIRLVLERLSLSGAAFPVLAALDQLRLLSLKENLLSGGVSDLSRLAALKFLFLSGNRFSGEIPAALPPRIYRLDLSDNNFTGEIPAVGLTRLPHLLTLRLDRNRLGGGLAGLDPPGLTDFNVSLNGLIGPVPPGLGRFGVWAFAGNPGLCGGPLRRCAAAVAAAPPVTSSPGVGPVVRRRRMTWLAAAGLAAAAAAVAAFWCFWRKAAAGSKLLEGEKIVYSSSPYGVGPYGGGAAGRMVVAAGTRRFELEELLRASAVMLGKGVYGTTYKAVMEDATVAVKRLREAAVGGAGGGGGSGGREFEHVMAAVGRVRNAHVVSLRAYYCARDEKLLVYDYMPGGSLFSLLHGNRAPGRTPLDWATRLKIATGAAKGLAYIHEQCLSPKLAHGNIKSSNILIDDSGAARVAEFGLVALIGSVVAATARGNGYRAPELAVAEPRKAATSHEADVFSFGVLLLELLTGKLVTAESPELPQWVQSVVREEWTSEVFDLDLMKHKDIEEELVAVLQIAMACTTTAPEQRPTMADVAKMLDEVHDSSPPSHDSFASLSDFACDAGSSY